MPLANIALKVMADHLAGLATRISLHSADPGGTGASETTAGRVVAGWPAADADGDLTLTNKPFSGGASNGAVTHVGLWSTDGATFYGGFPILNDGTNDLSFNAAGNYTLNSLTINGAST